MSAKVTLHNRCGGRAELAYIQISKSGPEHKPMYTYEVQVNGTTWGSGSGPNIASAQNAAAEAAMAFADATGAFGKL